MNYLIYKIINLINSNIYIGCHKTDDIDDGYMGSGKLIDRAIKKHGIENFKKEVLFNFSNEQEMFKKEKEIVSEEFLSRKDTYNINVGGNGSWKAANDKLTKEDRRRMGRLGGMVFANKLKLDKEFLDKHREISSDRMRARHRNGEIKYDNFKDKKHTDETKKKIGRINSINQMGKNNSQYGKCWIYNLDMKLSRVIRKEDLDFWINSGWIRGRKIKFGAIS